MENNVNEKNLQEAKLAEEKLEEVNGGLVTRTVQAICKNEACERYNAVVGGGKSVSPICPSCGQQCEIITQIWRR